MASEEEKQTVIEIMATVFETEPDGIDEQTSPTTLEAWDSLKHMNLVVALEEEFEVTFSEEELVEMMSLDAILSILGEKID